MNILIANIEKQKQKETVSDIWTDSKLKDIKNLQANNVGIVGESLVHDICVKYNILSTIDGSKTKEIGGGKNGDGKIKNKSVEIKTAVLGCDMIAFQHELGEHPWNADYFCFVDIAPKDVFLTIIKNFSKEQYEKKGYKCDPYFPTKSITRRKKVGNFKLDTTVKINNACIANNYSININKCTDKEIAEFINKSIE